MKPTIFRALPVTLFAIFALSAGADGQTTLSRDEVNKISRAVVRVVALDGGEEISSGSGTIVDRTGRIYTNRHVVEDGDDLEIQILDDLNERPVPMYRAQIVGYSADVDFAILQIDRDLEGRQVNAANLDLPALTLAEPDVQRGDPIFVFGYPGIGEGYLAFTEGAVTTIRNGTLGNERVPVWYQTDAQIAPGNSGGLAVNARSQIVGIPTAVQTEGTTGGRLGGILAIGAAQASIDAGLETDQRVIAEGTTSPVIEGGRLDFTEAPHFGSASLEAGFEPDPHTVDMVSGGEVDVDYLGGECTGYAAIAPDFRLNWDGGSSDLRIFFTAADGGDTTLLINRPDGSWICNDDAPGDTFDPMIVLSDAPDGQYDIWVASYSPGHFVEGELYITERDLEPATTAQDELDFSRNPYFGAASLSAGFTPDAYEAEIVAGGSVDVSYLGGSCLGSTAIAPDFRLNWTGRSDELRIFFEADDGGDDATIIVNTPDGTWLCNDDAGTGTLNPMVTMRNPAEGRYEIWIGSFDREEFISGVLQVTELDRSPR